MSYKEELQGNNSELGTILEMINTLPENNAEELISEHNVDENAHQDIREKIGKIVTEERVGEIVDEKTQWVSNLNLLANWYFANPVDERNGYVVPPGVAYYVSGASEPSGTTTGYVKVDFDGGAGFSRITIGGNPYVVPTSSTVRGYTGGGYTIDRWLKEKQAAVNTHGTLLVETDGIRLIGGGTGNDTYLRQKIADIDSLRGKTVTLSFLIDEIDGTWAIGQYADASSTKISTTGIVERTLVVSDHEYGAMMLWNTGNPNGQIKIRAAKLELGSQQTLAHQENGVWVLNEIPNYHEELLKCIQSTADASDTYANKTIATTEDVNGNAGYNKEETLSVNTKELYGLNASGTPDNIFSKLKICTSYYWKSRTATWVKASSELSSGQSGKTITMKNINTATAVVSYASDYTINEDGTFALTNPSTVTIRASYRSSDAAILRGKYWTLGSTNLYYSPSNASINDVTISNQQIGVTVNAYDVIITAAHYEYGEWDYSSSGYRNTFPDSGVRDGFDYIYKGNFFDLILLPKILE